MIDAAAAFIAWLGVSLLVASDGRRGLALGTALATLAIAVLALDHVSVVAAIAITVGGAVAAAKRFGAGQRGWGIMPAGSTPRLILCIAAGLLALWIAAGVTTGPGAPLRFTVMLVTGLAATRVFVQSAGEDVSPPPRDPLLSGATPVGIS